MDLKGFTTVDEVGGEDSQVRENSTSPDSFKPATAAEEIDYINKILADIEEKTGDSDTDVNGVQEDILCSVPELDSEPAEQQPTYDVLTQARELNDVTRGKEIASVHGLSAEPIVSSTELCKGELDSTQNQTLEGTDHDEGTCQTLTHGTSELSPIIEDTTSLAINTDNGDVNKLESRHHLVEDLSTHCVSGEKELKENEQEAHNSIVLGNIGDLLADSREPAVDPSLLESDKEEKDGLQSNEQQIGVLIKSEPVDAPEEEFDFGNALFDPAEEFHVKREVKEEPCDSLADEIPLDVSCQRNLFDGIDSVKIEPVSEDPCLVIPSVHFLVEDKIYNREQVTAAFLMSQSSLASVVDMNMFTDVGRSVLIVKTRPLEELIKNPSLIPLEDADILKKFISDNDKNLYDSKNRACLKLPKAKPTATKKKVKRGPKSRVSTKRQKKNAGKNGITNCASQKRPSFVKEECEPLILETTNCKLKPSEISSTQLDASVNSRLLLTPKHESDGHDSESEYIHLGSSTSPKKNKDKRKQKSPSKLSLNKDVFTFRKTENVLRSDTVLSSSVDCKPCYVSLVDISKNKEYRAIVSKFMHTIKTEQAAVELPVKIETAVLKLEGIEEEDFQTKREVAERKDFETDSKVFQSDIKKDEDSSSSESKIDRNDSADSVERLSCVYDESSDLQLSENKLGRTKGEAEDGNDSEEEALIFEVEPIRDDKECQEENGKDTVFERSPVCIAENCLGEEEGSKHCKDRLESRGEGDSVQRVRDTETQSHCKERLPIGNSEISNKRRSKSTTASDLEEEKSKVEKKRKKKSRKEQKLESTEEKAKRLSLKLNKIFKKEKEKHKREATSPDLQLPRRKKQGSTETRGKHYNSKSLLDDQGNSPTRDDGVLKNVFSRPVLNTFRYV